ncbi:hypothetical protein [Corynebacterium glyciniphilum]|uniref:hypothetical protein n=1 Tax=Corynebacterium glyciniphilum TaxID=1404244 RepID=UPI0011AB6CEB|nr:hypothetical protein [Corynebacterium glyciniphilum]
MSSTISRKTPVSKNLPTTRHHVTPIDELDAHADSPSVDDDHNESRAAQKTPHDADGAGSQSTTGSVRSDTPLPSPTEKTESPRVVAGHLLDTIAEARQTLLDKLARTWH